MSEEKKTEEVQCGCGQGEAEQQDCGCGQHHGGEQQEQCGCGRHGHHGHGGYGWHMAHAMRRRMWMRFATMTKEEEIELLEAVKGRLEERLKVVDERLAKLKA